MFPTYSQGDLESAERYYLLAARASPVSLLSRLQLLSLARDTAAYVSGQFSLATSAYRKVQKRKHRAAKASRTSNETGAALLSPLGASTQMDNASEGLFLLSTSLHPEVKDDHDNGLAGDAREPGKQSAHQGNELADLAVLQQREALHQRVLSVIADSVSNHQEGVDFDGSGQNVIPPGKFVYIDPFWLERLLVVFSDCDDWTWLARSRKVYRR